MEKPNPDDIRRASMTAGGSIRRKLEQLPPSPERNRLLGIARDLEEFWETASDDFARQWLDLAVADYVEGVLS